MGGRIGGTKAWEIGAKCERDPQNIEMTSSADCRPWRRVVSSQFYDPYVTIVFRFEIAGIAVVFVRAKT